MKLLDLFCGAGGCSVGYQRAGFEVVGWDIEPHADYPFEFHQGDALHVLHDRAYLDMFDVVHASPPCPRFSRITPATARDDHPDLLTPTRELLTAWGGTYVIENVPSAPMDHPALLCGASFGLGAICRDGRWRPLRRHRLFESNLWLMSAGCACGRGEPVGVYGHGGSATRRDGSRRGYQANAAEARAAMGIEWMRHEDVAQAIPPAYTEYLGEQILEQLDSNHKPRGYTIESKQ